MCCNKQESGQAMLGGLIFLCFVMLFSWYLISVTKYIRNLYGLALKNKFEVIEQASKYANILNQISFNNQNIIASVISSQVAYISAFETAITLSYEQPYWETYKLKNSSTTSVLSLETSETLEQTFKVQSHISGKSLFTAKSLSEKNKQLVNQLPQKIKKFFIQSSNNDIQKLSLEFLASKLNPSKFRNFFVPKTYRFGLEKTHIGLEHKTDFLHQLLNTSLPVLSHGESDFVIDFANIDQYSNTNDRFFYGIYYVKQQDALEFIKAIKFIISSPSKTVIRISHPLFLCKSFSKHGGDFIIENDWNFICDISLNKFLKSFFVPSWAALVTEQSALSN